MKKTRSNLTTITERIVKRNPVQTTTAAPTSSGNKAIPVPPSEEVIAKLNAIAREYPFCVMYRGHNLSLL